MSDTGKENRPEDAVREEAIAWLARLRSSADAEHHDAFEAWYAADPRHADIYDELLDNWDRMALAARTPIGEARARLDAPRPRQFRSGLAIAAALAFLMLTGIGLQRVGVLGGSRPDTAEIASRIGEIRTITLSDGSRVTLDTSSVLQIAYTGGERRLKLVHGRARFDVAHDAERPFIVDAGEGMVIAHGTLFDVGLEGRRVTVSLLQGTVEVRQAAGPRTGSAEKGQLLQPGERVSLEPETPPNPPVALRAGEARWPSGMLSFDDAPLAEVIAAANRYSAARIILADHETGDLRFTGTFKASDTPGLARMLAATFDLALSRDRQGNIVLAPRRPVQKIPG